jgi:hypothetical protein
MIRALGWAMPEAIALTPIPNVIRPKRKLDVVFVHGLSDNDIDAWQQKTPRYALVWMAA